MRKEEVENIVIELMKKLCMNNRELNDIIRCYTNKSFSVPIYKDIISILKGETQQEDEWCNLPECAKMVYFAWEDVIGSMMEFPEAVHFTDDQCPDCGEKHLLIDFWSPAWTWAGLCGRSGPMMLCVRCPKQVAFSLRLMS